MSHSQRFTLEKLEQRLELITPWQYKKQAALPPLRYKELAGPGLPAPVGPEVDDTGWPLLPAHTYWGQPGLDFVLRTSFQVPADWLEADGPLALHLPLGEASDFSHPEALAYIDGQPWAGCDRHHPEIPLAGRWSDGAPHLLALHGWTGIGDESGSRPGFQYYLRPAALVQIDPALRSFVAAARVALGTARALDPENLTRHRLLNALDQALLQLDLRQPGSPAFYASIPAARETLQSGLAACGAPLDVTLHAAGHAHIDVAWLWTLEQTRRKAGRTFHSALRLMEQFPDFHFTQSQPQLYEFVRQDYPELFEGIRQRVAEGRWEPIGGMWVEADCNLSGAEALARQFLLGRTWFQEHFGAGADSPVLWLPDVFGYAWALPQLILQAGLKYFMTIKIGWNQYNRLPYDSFWWQGLDGSRVLTHFSTVPEPGSAYASTYNAMAAAEDALGAWRNLQQKELHHDLLMAYGYGDGGGGPTREMVENLQVMAHFPALPQAQMGRAADFFAALDASAGEKLPVWNGELYLEIHRGTYTTQARSKRANRQSEFLLHDAEFLASLAWLQCGAPYPAAALQQAWRTLCLNQFHDILPGSSIGAVYAESLASYDTLRQDVTALRDAALVALGDELGGDLLLANPTSFPRNDLAFWPAALPEGLAIYCEDQPLRTQPVRGGTLIETGGLLPYSITTLVLGRLTLALPESTSSAAAGQLDGVWYLENEHLRAEFDPAGDLVRLYDRTNQREVLPSGVKANQLQAYEDRPLNWDAWDIDIFFEEKCWLAEPAESIQVVEQGPLRAALQIERCILHSRTIQHISLCAGSHSLDIQTRIDWRERHVLLKAAFPVNVLSPVANYEIQWGQIQRPTHRNTSWDWARFETCAHKWADLSEGGYGVSLLNDCKYGHDIHDNIIRLTLLRSPTVPDPEADQGEHEFAYRLLPHAGGVGEATSAAAYGLNDPLVVYDRWGKVELGASLTHSQPPPQAGDGWGEVNIAHSRCLLSITPTNAIIETVKLAEDGRGLIVRLYESQRRRGPVEVICGFPLSDAWITNLLEENQVQVPVSDTRLELHLNPFQIVTLRLVPGEFKRRNLP